MADSKQQLSIYSSAATQATLEPAEPTYLGSQIGSLRRTLQDSTASLRDSANSTRASFIAKESQVESRVQALVDAREMNSQNAFSVAVAFLGGSIMARPRGFLLRTIFPIATGLGAAAYFMPNTVNNVDQAWYRWEQENAPALAQAREQFRGQLTSLREQFRNMTGK